MRRTWESRYNGGWSSSFLPTNIQQTWDHKICSWLKYLLRKNCTPPFIIVVIWSVVARKFGYYMFPSSLWHFSVLFVVLIRTSFSIRTTTHWHSSDSTLIAKLEIYSIKKLIKSLRGKLWHENYSMVCTAMEYLWKKNLTTYQGEEHHV